MLACHIWPRTAWLTSGCRRWPAARVGRLAFVAENIYAGALAAFAAVVAIAAGYVTVRLYRGHD